LPVWKHFCARAAVVRRWPGSCAHSTSLGNKIGRANWPSLFGGQA